MGTTDWDDISGYLASGKSLPYIVFGHGYNWLRVSGWLSSKWIVYNLPGRTTVAKYNEISL
jgi:hypothetical protein